MNIPNQLTVLRKMTSYLDSLTVDDALPKCVFRHINPVMLCLLATLTGSYQDGVTAGKTQLGSG